jgi:hypothetical protein
LIVSCTVDTSAAECQTLGKYEIYFFKLPRSRSVFR